MDDLLYISELIKKSWSDELTETEKKYLNTWINKSEANRKLFEKRKEEVEKDLLNLEKYDINLATKRFFAHIEDITGNDVSVQKITNRKQLWWAVAASAILIVSVSVWIFRPNQIKRLAEHTPSKIRQDSLQIKPGGNNAILTLSDGSYVVLDSAADGVIGNQGNTKVIKLESGKLAYTGTANKKGNVSINKISTPRGGQYQVTLPDGTIVWLNAASSISFPTAFAETERQVEVTGEVYFEVAAVLHNQTKVPFVVKIASSSGVNIGEVHVLGTHFNVNAYDDEIETRTTLLEGAVKCIKGSDSKTLKPGQQGRFAHKGISIEKDIDTDKIVAWKYGMFLFDSEDIQGIMRQIGRWYNVEVIYKGAISKELFSGIVDRSSRLEQVLKIMEAGGVKFTIDGRKIIVIQ